MIDAEKLREVLENVKHHLEAYPNVLASYKACVMALIDIVNAQPAAAPPPNDPLTLEQLREMDGEPVWVKSLDKDYGEWVIARTIELEGICLFTVVGATHQYGENGTMDGYGKTWLAYRRRPEENAT